MTVIKIILAVVSSFLALLVIHAIDVQTYFARGGFGFFLSMAYRDGYIQGMRDAMSGRGYNADAVPDYDRYLNH